MASKSWSRPGRRPTSVGMTSMACASPTVTTAQASSSFTFRQPSRRRRSHRLEGAVEIDVDQPRAAALEPLREKIGRLVHRPRPIRLDPERACETDEIDRRVGELHADIAVGLLGKPAHIVQALLENAI